MCCPLVGRTLSSSACFQSRTWRWRSPAGLRPPAPRTHRRKLQTASLLPSVMTEDDVHSKVFEFYTHGWVRVSHPGLHCESLSLLTIFTTYLALCLRPPGFLHETKVIPCRIFLVIGRRQALVDLWGRSPLQVEGVSHIWSVNGAPCDISTRWFTELTCLRLFSSLGNLLRKQI